LAAKALTVLVSTHYMDEAERCDGIACIAYGQILVRGTIDKVIQGSRLTTYVVTGDKLDELETEISGRPGVDMVVPVGSRLHVMGRHRAALETAVAPCRASPAWNWAPSKPSLEDVFADLIGRARDHGNRS
jgi:ABC-2 type transport system ATP-binding protein